MHTCSRGLGGPGGSQNFEPGAYVGVGGGQGGEIPPLKVKPYIASLDARLLFIFSFR